MPAKRALIFFFLYLFTYCRGSMDHYSTALLFHLFVILFHIHFAPSVSIANVVWPCAFSLYAFVILDSPMLKNFSLSSNPVKFQLCLIQLNPVVNIPPNGSNTMAFSFVNDCTKKSTNPTGNVAGCFCLSVC